MIELKPCPFGADHKVWIAVHDDEGNYHGEIGCEYETDPWSGLSYGLHHDGWGTCPLCTDDDYASMGGMLFDTPEEAAEAWNTRWERTCRCDRCGAKYKPTNPNQRYCSKDCKNGAYVDRRVRDGDGVPPWFAKKFGTEEIGE